MEAFGVLGCYRSGLHLPTLEASRLFFNQSKTVRSIVTKIGQLSLKLTNLAAEPI
jgi:hypothetical protein